MPDKGCGRSRQIGADRSNFEIDTDPASDRLKSALPPLRIGRSEAWAATEFDLLWVWRGDRGRCKVIGFLCPWKTFLRYPRATQIASEIDAIPDGWALAPLQGKSPKRKGWQTEEPLDRDFLKSLITDGEEATSQKTGKPYRRYYSGFGLRTGEVSEGSVAIDVDGDDAAKLLEEIAGDNLPQTVSWTSGKPGRRQLLYRVPDAVREQIAGFTRRAIREWDGVSSNHDLDFRYNGCQSALPPSGHPDTGSYRWIDSPADVEVAIAPDWLCALLLKFTNQERAADEAKRRARQEQFRQQVKRQQFAVDGNGADLLGFYRNEVLPKLNPEQIYNWAGHNWHYTREGMKGCPPWRESQSGQSFHVDFVDGQWCWFDFGSGEGEDVETALRFLFNAMSAKTPEDFLFRGIPKMLYTDNGPIAKSQVFQNVMEYLGVKVVTHLPRGKDGRRVTARAKGKVERPFRTVKEAHETLYHFHTPETEEEANQWLHNYLRHYNNQPHRSESHSRLEDWRQNLPSSGIRQMCTWERFCTFAREPQRRQVGIDARISIDGVSYEVEPDLAGEAVILWWGLFDNELYVEKDQKRYGPFYPIGGPIPLNRYRSFKKTKTAKRAERIEALAKQLGLPHSAWQTHRDLPLEGEFVPSVPLTVVPFQDPDPFQEFTYPTVLSAKRAIADYLARPLAKLSPQERVFIDELLRETLNKRLVLERVRDYFCSTSKGEHSAE